MPSFSSLRVLVVEDEILIALELENLLQDEGHDPIGIASSLPEALRLAEDGKPDLAFVDVHLADGPTGIEVARRLAAGRPTAVLFTTANAKRVPETLVGAWGVIAKPYTERTIRSALSFVSRCLSGETVERAPDGIALAPDFRDRLIEAARPSPPPHDPARWSAGFRARR